MDKVNPLDTHLDNQKNRIPEDLKNAVIDVADQMDLAWMATQSVFKDAATPELAVMVYDRLIAHQATAQD